MLILKYFKPLRKDERKDDKRKDVILPNLYGPLSIEVPPGAVEAANQKVSEINIQPSGGSTAGSTVTSSRGSYIKLTPAQRLLIGKQAAEHSIMVMMRYFAKKYPDEFGSLKETTVTRLKNLYKTELQFSDSQVEDLKEFPLRKQGDRSC